MRKKRFRTRARNALLIGVGLFVAAEGIMVVDEISGWKSRRLFDAVDRAVGSDANTFKKSMLVPGFAPVALSNASEGAVNVALRYPDKREEAIALVDRAIALMIHPAINPYKRSLSEVRSLGPYGLYLSHLNIALGAYQRLSGDKRHVDLNRRISHHLALESLRDPSRHMSSFAGSACRWPADQTATLYSLYLFDRNNGAGTSPEPIRQWLATMEARGTDSATGLHLSEVNRAIGYWKYPRGCALSWSARYLHRFAPQASYDLWSRYKQHYKRDFGLFAFFNEYPAGVTRGMDSDAGPIIFGMGTSATAFAVGSAKALGDPWSYFQLSNTFFFVDGLLHLVPIPLVQKLAFDPLANGIRLNAFTQIAWYPSR